MFTFVFLDLAKTEDYSAELQIFTVWLQLKQDAWVCNGNYLLHGVGGKLFFRFYKLEIWIQVCYHMYRI